MRVLSCPGAARAGWGRTASSVHDRSNLSVRYHVNNVPIFVLPRSCTTRSWRVRANVRGHGAAFTALAPEGTERTDWRGDQLNVAFSCWRDGLPARNEPASRRANQLQRDVRWPLVSRLIFGGPWSGDSSVDLALREPARCV